MVDEEGRYAGEMEFYAYGPFKAEAMRELADARGSTSAESSAYSDSYTDLPMLEAVGHPVAVNPDRVLAKVAREREWEVMQFTKPVRLRDRVSVPSLPMTAAAAGITAAASVGALVAWRLARRPPARPQPRRHRSVSTRRSARSGWDPIRVARPRRGRGGSGRTQPLGGDDTEGNDDGEDQELLHEQRSYSLRSRCSRATAPVASPRRSAPVPRPAATQTVSRSRAPVSDEGWRSLDMARASI